MHSLRLANGLCFALYGQTFVHVNIYVSRQLAGRNIILNCMITSIRRFYLQLFLRECNSNLLVILNYFNFAYF
jgi:hypothetical protein